MLDVHPPHQSPHGWRDFLLHLFTITIGLLIAVSLEGLVEWQHHRHLAHDAEASLHAEIQSNAAGMGDVLADLHKKQESLKNDVSVLKVVIATGKLPKDSSLEINFRIVSFDDVSWKTAQSTDALAYMPYDMAKEYASMYATQNDLSTAEKQAARDAILSLGPFINDQKGDPALTPAQAEAIVEKIEVLQAQLLLVDSLMKGLDTEYKQFLAAHP
jgi:hypothetical protein